MLSKLKIFVCFALICFGLMLASSIADLPHDAKKISPQVKELKAKRLEVLGEAFALAKALVAQARIEVWTTLDVAAKYFEARREQAETQADRIKICEEEVQEAEKILEFMRQRKSGGLHILMSQAYLLGAQITLENAKTVD